ncbi:hypothetical protein [Aquibaculum sediminis]|uniref:hypothetical protein n=1 Tax=Aquibaculum sediminis TaxID=3231907 RepID=UPI0034543A3B
MLSNEASKGFMLASSFIPESAITAFRGIAYTDQQIIVGPNGFNEYKYKHNIEINSINEGRFSLFVRDERVFWAKCDNTGQDILYYYASGSNWAVSNSFYMLASHLVRHGVSLNVDEDSVRSFFIDHNLGQQLVSHRTMVREIRVLPLDHAINIRLNSIGGGECATLVRCYNVTNAPAIDVELYRHCVQNYCIKWASRLHCLVSHYKNMESVDLSGGVDSRLNLSLLSASGYDVSEINICSNAAQVRDYEVAQKVVKAVGARIQNKKLPSAMLPGSKRYNLWKLGNLGIYSPVYGNSRADADNFLHLHGAGGGCFRQVYQKKPEEIIDSIKSRCSAGGMGNSFSILLREAFNDMQHSMLSDDAMMLHYRFFRSRFHFGRNAYRSFSSVLITPLSSPDLMFATRYLSDEERNNNQLALDIFLLTNPKLAEIEFDSKSKEFTKTAKENSVFHKENQIRYDKLDEYTVYSGKNVARSTFEQGDDVDFISFLREDLDRFYEPVVKSNLVVRKIAAESIKKLDTKNSLSKRARGAASIISAGEVLNLCGQL